MNTSDNGRHATRAPSLDEALAALPTDIAPMRDLWPDIEAQLAERRPARRWRWQLAAAVALVAASSLITAALLRDEPPAPVAADIAPAPAATVPDAASPAQPLSRDALPIVPASTLAAYAPGAEYFATRQRLLEALAMRLERLPPGTRVRIQGNLDEIRRAADEIEAELAQQPGDPLLGELLVNTYQDELAVIATVNQLTQANGASNGADETRTTL